MSRCSSRSPLIRRAVREVTFAAALERAGIAPPAPTPDSRERRLELLLVAALVLIEAEGRGEPRTPKAAAKLALRIVAELGSAAGKEAGE